MNLSILEYVVETAKSGSISRAAQNLFLSQPHLSNSIKSLEAEIGVELFERSAKGMQLTEEGRVFVKEASDILENVARLKRKITVNPNSTVRASVSVTRSHQINQCITEFINENTDKESFVLHVKETNPFQVVEDVAGHKAELGILHIFEAQKEYFINSFRMNALEYRQEYEREFLLAVPNTSPLAGCTYITSNMLNNLMVVIYGDYESPTASYEAVSQVNDMVFAPKRVYAYDRASAMEILSKCPMSYMWITGLHVDTLKHYGLVLKKCEDINVKNIGFSITRAGGMKSKSIKELYNKMRSIDWTEKRE